MLFGVEVGEDMASVGTQVLDAIQRQYVVIVYKTIYEFKMRFKHNPQYLATCGHYCPQKSLINAFNKQNNELLNQIIIRLIRPSKWR